MSKHARGRTVSTDELWSGLQNTVPTVQHYQDANVALLQAAREALDIAGEFLRRHLAR
ncbi:MAG TPA: hypothetical protein VII69_14220 [Candidatus Eremiobacteraceae bacterium]